MPGVAVVVPARNAARTLPATLDALGAQTLAPESVVVVDNGSSDATGAIARAHPAVTQVVAGPGRGPGPARNTGVAACAAPLVAFTDADCVPTPGWLAALAAAGEGGASIVQGRVAPDPAATRTPWERTLAVPGFTGLFESANLLVPRRVLDRVGGFGAGIEDPGDPPFGEDALLGWSAVATGARAVFAADALVHHAVLDRPAAAFVAERHRLRHFPALVAAAPGVRDTFLRDRLFLTEQTRAFDLAVAGAALAVLARHPAPLLAALPYARRLRRLTRHWPAHPSPQIALTHLRADAVGAAALLRGSLRHGATVL